MVKAKSPYLSEIRGKMGEYDFRTRKNATIEIGRTRTPTIPLTEKQLYAREVYGKAVAAWRALTNEEKKEWNEEARAEGISGYNAFMRAYIVRVTRQVWYAVTANNSGSALTNQQIRLTITGNAQALTDLMGDPYLEAYAADTATMIPFWIESWDADAGNASIWLKIANIPAGQNVVAYLKGNPSRTESLSSPSSVFDFWDDMDSQGSWSVVRVGGNGFATWSNSYLKIKSTSHRTVVNRPFSFSNHAVIAKVYAYNPVGCFSLKLTDGSYNAYGDAYNAYTWDWNGWAGSANRQRIRRFSSLAETTLASTETGLMSSGSTYSIMAYWNSPTLKHFNDYSQNTQATDAVYNSRSNLAISVWGSFTYQSEYWVDWIAVTKTYSQTLTVSVAKA